jgi:hypothetical protein
MREHLMQNAVLLTCHTIIPVLLAVTGFFVVAVMTHHLIMSCSFAAVAGFVALGTASRYTLIAIGPRFVDSDYRMQHNHELYFLSSRRSAQARVTGAATFTWVTSRPTTRLPKSSPHLPFRRWPAACRLD